MIVATWGSLVTLTGMVIKARFGQFHRVGNEELEIATKYSSWSSFATKNSREMG